MKEASTEEVQASSDDLLFALNDLRAAIVSKSRDDKMGRQAAEDEISASTEEAFANYRI